MNTKSLILIIYIYKEAIKMKNEDRIKNSIIGLVISVYIACTFIFILNLPNMFCRFISWMGCEEVTLI